MWKTTAPGGGTGALMSVRHGIFMLWTVRQLKDSATGCDAAPGEGHGKSIMPLTKLNVIDGA